MKKLYLSLFMLLSVLLQAQDAKELELKSEIEAVTVFLKGAQISRKGTIRIPQGKSSLIVKGLSPHMDGKSVQVKSTGDFTILSVNHGLNYLSELTKDDKIDNLRQEIEGIEEELRFKSSRIDILKETESLLDKNKELTGYNNSLSLTQLQQAIQFYDRELTRIKDSELKLRKEMRALNESKEKLQKQISEVAGERDLPSGEITIRVDAATSANATFEITYLVSNAGWFPNYDVRVADVESPVRLDYKADVYQNTGVDWKEVKLKFSNGDPNQSGVAPELATWFLNYPRNTIYQSSRAYDERVGTVSGKIVDDTGEGLPGVNVIVKGTTVGTTTDLNGNYSLTLPSNARTLVYSYVGFESQERAITSSRQDVVMDGATELQEVVVTGYSGAPGASASSNIRIRGVGSLASTPKTNVVENQTTVEFEIDDPYTIKSNGEKLSINLNSYDIDALYEYYAVPKLDKDAFLIARVIDWDQYNLLEGEANLYFEDGYVGRTILDAKSLSDTLDISLGRDKSIVIGREKIEDFTRRRTIGSNKVETRGYDILVRNKKSQKIALTLYDQLPVAAISDITVEAIDLSGGRLNEQTGQVAWRLEVQPNEQKDLTLKYEVKYPKKERLVLE